MKKRHIGLYGGSFDPIHLGHINLAISIMEAHQLNEVWLCPTAYNPLKPEGCKVSSKDRLEMVKLAIEDVPNVRLVDIEIFRRGPSFTVDTLQQLMTIQEAEGLSDDFSLIIGEDVARTFYQWNQPEKILKHASVLVGQRTKKFPEIEFEGPLKVVQSLKKGSTPIRTMEISSTEIRERIAKNLYCGHLLPRKVLDYIVSHKLYCV